MTPTIPSEEVARRLEMLKAAPSFTTEEVIKRLEILWWKLEDEGMYVRANTVALAIEEIKRPRK